MHHSTIHKNIQIFVSHPLKNISKLFFNLHIFNNLKLELFDSIQFHLTYQF